MNTPVLPEAICPQPKDDGVTHINLYTKGATPLGRGLSNLNSQYPFTHPQWGKWRTLEGLWYFLGTGCTHWELQTMDGFLAKKHGRGLPRVERPTFDRELKIGMLCKVMQNPELLELFLSSTLPFTHYYYYGDAQGNPKVIADLKSSAMICNSFEWLRLLLQAH